MADTLTPSQRSARMALVRNKDTKPELIVRRMLHGMGYRYRLHRADLPGRPDLVFPKRKKALFVHGCFWHRHDCALGRMPHSRQEFWAPKLEANRTRDQRNIHALVELGWDVLVVWECELRDAETVATRLRSFLDA